MRTCGPIIGRVKGRLGPPDFTVNSITHRLGAQPTFAKAASPIAKSAGRVENFLSTHGRNVDKPPKKRYNGAMEEENLARIIGTNIMRLRKLTNMTQLELADKLGYSDKSVSKWEQGNGIPDVRTLLQIAECFNVNLDDLVREHTEKPVMPKKTRGLRRLIIILLSVGLCWLVAVVSFVFGGIISPGLSYLWLAFVYAVPASAIVILVFSCIWRYKLYRILSLSVLIWTVLACIYLTVVAAYGDHPTLWLIFLIGIPLQLLALFFFVWWKRAGTDT